MSNLGIGNYHLIKKEGDYAFRIQAGFLDEFHMWCPKFTACVTKVHQGPPDAANAIWSFNGDYDAPTIVPSIGCDHAPRCGRHVTVTKGVITP